MKIISFFESYLYKLLNVSGPQFRKSFLFINLLFVYILTTQTSCSFNASIQSLESPIFTPEVTQLKSNIPAITNLPSIPVTISFNVPVSNLQTSELQITNGTVSSIVQTSDRSFEFVVTPIAEGEVRLNLVDGKVDSGTQLAIQKQEDLVLVYDVTSPQLTITTTSPTPTSANSFPITINASEAIKDFISSDLTVTNGTVSSFIKISDSLYTATITPLADGVVSVSTSAAIATDLAGNPNIAAAPLNVVSDRTGPLATLDQSGLQVDPTNALPISFTVVFSEAIDPSTFTASDITQNGTSTGVTWSLATSDNITWTLLATAANPGTLVPSLATGKVTDIAGNNNAASTSTDNSVTYDLSNPGVTINQSLTQIDPTNSLPVAFTIVFSKAINPATFSVTDITQNGTASGITWNLTTADNITWTLQATAVTTPGTIVPSLAAGLVSDSSGNTNTASTSTDNSVTYDITAPSLTINQAAGQVDPTNSLPVNFTIVFSEPIDPATFTSADITQGGTASGITWALSTSDNITWNLQATAVTTAGTLVPSVSASKVTDLAGNGNNPSSSTDNSVTYDITAPTLTINQGSSQTDPTNTLPITFDIVFSKPINPATFTIADISHTGTASGITWNLTTSDNITWTLQATAVTTPGTLIPSVNASLVTDLAGNQNTASTSTDHTVTYDLSAPSVTINQSLAQVDPTNSLPISFTVVFSKAINPATFTVADITQNGSALGITWNLSTSDNITWTLQATSITTPGTLIPSIAANLAQDSSGNLNSASTFTDNSVTYDLTAPSLTINQAGGQTDPTNSLPISFTLVFSEAIDPATFSAADIRQNGSATGITWNLNTSDNITWTLQATTVGTAGTVIPSVDAAKVTDLAGNNNLASTSTDNSVTYDISGPSLTINQAGGQIDPTNAVPISFTVVFSEAINPATFTTGDITQNGTASGITWNLTTSDNITWTLQATAITTAGTVVPSIAAAAVQDPAGNGNTASTSTDNSVTYDITAPTLTINQAGGQVDPANSLPISYTLVFSEAIDPASFTVADITQNGTASGITWNLNTADNITWTLQATAITTPGTVIPTVAAAKVKDLAGNDNAASTSTDNSVVYDIAAPTLTINQAGGQADPTNALPISFTVTFSEPMNPASFTTADVTQNGTATGITWNLTTSDNTTWTLQATAISSAGTVVPSIAAGQVFDLAGNGNSNSTSTDNTVTYDITSPTLAITSTELNPTNNSPFTVTFTFSEAVTNFALGDIVVGNGAASGFITVSPTVYTALITPGSEGVVTVDVPAAVAQDLAGNPNLAATQFSITYDGLVPAVTVEQAVGQVDPANSLPITFAVTFTKAIDPATFTVSDITQNGSASGITWNLSTSNNKDWILQATAVTTPGTLVPSIAANTVKDSAGNDNLASSSADNSVTYDITAPSLTINQAGGQTDPTKDLPISFTVVFSEAINPATFTTADITQGGSATGITWNLTTSDNITWTLQATAVTTPGTLVPSIAATTVTDLAGNSNTASTSTDNSVTYDNVAPTLTINQAGGQVDPANSLPVSFTVVFSEAINPATFTVADITQNGTASGITWNLNTADNITWTLQATAVTTTGTLIPSIAAVKVTDFAGNSNSASTSTDNSVLYDNSAPSLTINQAGGQLDPANTLPISFDVVFSEAINPATFTVADITQNGTASGITWSLNTADNITWTLQATAVTTPGTLIPSIAAAKVTDLSGNNNSASTSTDNSVTYDITAPTLTINQAGGQVDPTNATPISFTVVFSEAINPATFTAADITQNGTASGITWSLNTADNITWTLQATAITTAGTVIPSVGATKVTDPAGNSNTASTSTDNSVTYDNSGPTLTLNQAGGQVDPTNALPISFTAVFSEAINPATFTVADITQNGTAAGITWNLSTSDNITWTLQATAITTPGTVIPSIAAAKVTDLSGNNNSASTSTDNSVTYDTTAPTLTINQAGGQLDPINTLPISFTVVFSEAINPTSFTVADITQSGTASGITWNLSTSDNITWTLNATAITTAGTVVPSIGAATITDPAGNSNTASTSTDNSVTYDITAPTLTINQAGGQVDPTNAVPVSFTVVFSEAIKASTFTTADITQNGTASGITWNLSTSDNITWTLQATTVTTPGTLIPSIAVAKVTDPAGNNNTASTSTDNSVTIDNVGPTLTINQAGGQVDPTNALPISFTIVFNEAINPATFTVADITQSGTASGITWNLNTSDNITWTLQATAITTAGTVIPSITAAKVTDVSGNNNSASTSTDNTVTYDLTAPTLAITAPVTSPTNSNPFVATFTFSEAVTGFALSDIVVGNGSASNFTVVSSSVYTAQINPGSSGTVTIDVAAAVAQDLATNPNVAATQFSVVYDGTAPTLTINQAGGQVDPTNALPVDFTVVFSEAINPASFTVADITQGGTASGITWTLSTADNITWTLRATAITTAGTLIPSLAAAKVTDVAGNNNTASTSTDNSVKYDISGPTLTINQAGGQTDPTNTLPISFTVVFNEAINPATFTTADITQSGTASGITWSLSTSDNITWTLNATAITTAGTVVPSIGASKVTDLAGNNNSASTSTDNSVTYDITAPTLTINQAGGQVDPTNALPVSFTVVFSEAIAPATFTAADITQNGTATGVTWTLSTADNITWTLRATVVTGAGTLIPSIAAAKVTDLAGNNNTASTSTDNSVTYDNVAPTLTINQAGGQADPTSKVPVNFTVVFSEAINPATFTVADITQGGTATGITWNLSTSDNITWTLQATASGYGTLIPSIAAAKVTDLAGNNNTASTSTDNSVNYLQIFLSIANVSVTEGGSATVVASINSAHDQAVTFNWATSSGTAISGTDFTASSGTAVTIPAGSTSVNLSIPTTNDVLDEDDETFTVTLSSPTVATISTGTATVTILDNDASPTVAFSAASQTISETTATGSMTVSLSAVSGRNVSVPYTVSGTANNPADHNLASGTLTITAGSTTGTINFSLVNDLSYESNETLIVTLGTPTNATLGATTVHTATITSDDPPPVISIANVTVGEGDPAQFTVSLNAASSVDTTVNYATTDGTAISGTNYTGATGSLTIPAGSTSGIISIATTENAINQASAEWTFTVTLSAPVNGTLGTSTATGTIQDDDNPPGPLYITGITGGLDENEDEFLADGLNPTVSWAKSPGATSYTVVIRDNADTTDVCAQISTVNLYASFSSCTLTLGTKYKAKVSAWKIASPMVAINSPYTFTVSAPPPVSFAVTGITGGSDVTPDNFLENGTYATVNWNLPSVDATYSVSIYDSAGTTLVCGPTAVPAGTSSYAFSACALGAAQYRAKVVATDTNGNSKEASNSMYPFQLPKVATVCVDTSVTDSFLGTIYDSGGSGGNYSKNEACNLLLNPPGSSSVDVTFTQFSTRESGDYMYVYDGTNTSGMPYGSLWGSTLPNPISASSGAAFITWISNNSKQDIGWTMTYKSEPPSPGAFNITGVTSSPTDSTVDAWMNGTTGLPTINWSASSTAVNYDVWITESSGNIVACPKQTSATTSYTFSTCALVPGSSYGVFVTARDSWGMMTQATNSGYYFTYDPGPSAFNISGITGGGDTTVNADLSDGYNPTINWEDTTRETSYKITVYLDNGTTVKCATVTTPPDITSYSLDACSLDSTTYYKVKMEAVSISGVTKVASNSLYRFYVSSLPSPPAPFNILGVTGGTDTIVDTTLASTTFPTVQWQAAARATNYDVTVYNSDGVTVKCPTQNTTGTSYNFSACGLTNGVSYKVAVVAKDPTAQTTSATNSLTFQFTVDISPPGAFTITGVKGGLDVTADATLLDGNTAVVDWAASTDAVSYKLSIYRDDGVTLACVSVFPISTVALTYNVSGCLLTEDLYYKIRVTAVDNVGNEANATNDLYRFRVDAKATINMIGSTFPEGVGTVNAVVTLDHAVLRDTTFNYYTGGGTSTAGSDYTAVATTPIVIPAGTTTYNLPVTILDDQNEESSENFTVYITGANSPVGTPSVSMTIEDNDDDVWMAMGGNYLAWSGTAATYGTQGVPSTSNYPSTRYGGASFTDASNNLWLFGGNGVDATQTTRNLHDLWKYNPSTAEWTWVGGLQSGTQAATYGTKGVAAPSNWPGGRYDASYGVDGSGDFWVFGGYSSSPNGSLSDLWKYSPSTGQWTWMSGPNTANTYGVYGTMGTPSTANNPGARQGSAMWIDASNNIWIFGGVGYAASGSSSQRLNDLWKFNPATGEWTWVQGSQTPFQKGTYGTRGVANAANIPGARSNAGFTEDSNGKFWLFGGEGVDKNSYRGYLNDLWKFDPSTQQWTWVHGSDTVNALNNNYSYRRVTSPTSTPGSRTKSSLNFFNGYLWVMGGYGEGYAATEGNYGKQDLWKFDLSISQWALVKGSTGNYPYINDYNSSYPNYPRSLSNPSSGYGRSSWATSDGKLWIYGGMGGYGNGGSGGCCNTLNTFWKFSPDTVTKIILGDTNVTEGQNASLYASLNYPSAQNVTFNWATGGGSATAGTDYTSSSGTGVNIPAGSSAAALTIPTATDTTTEPNETINVAISSPTNATIVRASGVVNILDDDAKNAVIRGPTSILSNKCSPGYFLESVDGNGNTVNVPSAEAVTLGGNGLGAFYSNNTCSTTITSVTIASGTSRSPVFYYKNANVENLIFNTSPTTLLSSTLSVTVQSPSNTPNRLALAGNSSLITGSCTLYQASVRDSTGNPAAVLSNTTINLAIDGNNIKIYSDSACTTVTSTVTVLTGSSYGVFYLKGPRLDSGRTLMASHASLGYTKNTINTVSSASTVASRIVISGPNTLPVSTCTSYTSTSVNDDGVATPLSNSTSFSFLNSSTGNGRTFTSNSDCATNFANYWIWTPSTTAKWYFKSTVPGPDIIGSYYSSNSMLTTYPVVVTPDQTIKIAVAGPKTITTGSCNAYTLSSQDSNGNSVNVGSNTSLTLGGQGLGFFYTANDCLTTTTSATIASGTSSTTVYYKTSSGPSVNYLSAFGTGVNMGVLKILVSASPSRLSWSGPTSLNRGQCGAYTITNLNASDVATNFGSTVTIYLGGADLGNFYSDVGCTTPITNVTGNTGTNSSYVYYKSNYVRSSLPFYAMTNSSAILDGSYNISVNSTTDGIGLNISGNNALSPNTCSKYKISIIADNGESSLAGSNVTVNLGGAGSGAFYSNSGCSSTITSTSIASGTSSTDIYYKNASTQVVTLTAADGAAALNSTSMIVEITLPFTDIAAGYYHACAVRGGAVYCWGNNSLGQLGDGTTTSRSAAAMVTGLSSGVTQVVTGDYFSCALQSGAVKCWGQNSSGQLGNSSFTNSLTPVAVTNLTTGVTQISARVGSACAIQSGAAFCWGANTYGQLGNNTTTSSNLPVAVSGLSSGVTWIEAGGYTSCAIVSGGVKCWGYNSAYAAGQPTTSNVLTPQTVGTLTSGMSQVTSNAYYSCAISVAGTYSCWGYNAYGGFGTGSSGTNSNTVYYPTALASGVTAADSNTYSSCVVKDGGLFCMGDGYNYQLGNGNTNAYYSPTPVVGLSSNVTKVAVGNYFACAIANGNVSCWGSNSYGQIGSSGDAFIQGSPVPVASFPSTASKVAAGGSHTCALTTAGVGYCWGLNSSGQLGDGTNTPSVSPVAVTGTSGTLNNISSGDSHSCATNSTGAAFCWGINSSGQLGNSATANSSVAVSPVGMSANVTAITTGISHTCAIQSGAAYCWGDNAYGQLGNSSTTNSTTPVAVTGLTSGVTSIAAGSNFTCAVQSGAVKCWGANSAYQLGLYTTYPIITAPIQVANLTSGATQVIVGAGHACATVSGYTYCWGSGNNGQYGNGNTVSTYVPQLSYVSPNPTAIFGGGYTNCSIENSEARCWGSGSSGQVGYGGSTPSVVYPTLVQYLGNVTTMSVGAKHSCAIQSDGKIFCWGEYQYGKLGYYPLTTGADGLTAVPYPSSVKF